MGRRIRDIHHHLTAKILAIILLFVLPLNTICIGSTLWTNRQMYRQAVLGMEKQAGLFSATLDFEMDKADRYLFALQQEKYECIVLKHQKGDLEYVNARYQCHLELSRQLSRESRISGYYLLMQRQEDQLVECTPALSALKEELEDWLAKIAEEDAGWNLVRLGGQECLIRVSNLKDFFYGAVISLEEIREELLVDGQYGTAQVQFQVEDVPGEEKGRLGAVSRCSYWPLSIGMTVEWAEISARTALWQGLLLAVDLLLLLAVPVMYFYMKRIVVEPLNQLNEAHDQMRQGNRAYQIEARAASAEFQRAFDSFNMMMNSMENLRLENMKQELENKQLELEKKELELNNLQLQIRPHFLQNAFNMIYMLCANGRVEPIKQMVLYLADYFRYIFRSGRELELFGREEELIRKYVEIAKIRYPKGLSVQYMIEPELYLLRVPPLLVHNFIENVVNHGMVRGRTVHVVLAGQYEDGMVEIQVSDDGTGMSAEEAEVINTQGWEKTGNRHLGLRNSLMRMKYFYGEEACLSVESEIGVGTTFILRFPADLEEE